MLLSETLSRFAIYRNQLGVSSTYYDMKGTWTHAGWPPTNNVVRECAPAWWRRALCRQHTAEEFYIISLVHLQHVKWIILFRAPVHAAPACAGSGEGSDHFGSIVRSLSLHFCKRLFPGLEPVTSWSQGSSFTTAPRLPFWLHSFDSRYIFSLGLFTKENDLG
ncbi:uncharacterized protein [Triticum aestivum]|uniref:uncharacterized protein isoform X4 n=2 Tax=Triticum aestivum TaxID=4565 RepID=UPI001D03163E|nr:uncharacterized protein LOC123044951 isoform X4 [Triticum aestivum]